MKRAGIIGPRTRIVDEVEEGPFPEEKVLSKKSTSAYQEELLSFLQRTPVTG